MCGSRLIEKFAEDKKTTVTPQTLGSRNLCAATLIEKPLERILIGRSDRLPVRLARLPVIEYREFGNQNLRNETDSESLKYIIPVRSQCGAIN